MGFVAGWITYLAKFAGGHRRGGVAGPGGVIRVNVRQLDAAHSIGQLNTSIDRWDRIIGGKHQLFNMPRLKRNIE